MKKILAGMLLSGAMALGSAQAYADTLFNNGSAGANTGWCNNNNGCGGTGWWIFDDFTLAADSVVTGFTYDSRFSSGTSSYASTNWSIWSVSPKFQSPGDEDFGANNVVGTLTPLLGSDATVSIGGLSLALGAGTYWLGMQNNLNEIDANSTFLQSSTGGNGVKAFQWENDGTSLLDSPSDAAFTIQGTTVAAVPEPETYAMLLAGLGMLGFMARRRKQKEAVAA